MLSLQRKIEDRYIKCVILQMWKILDVLYVNSILTKIVGFGDGLFLQKLSKMQ